MGIQATPADFEVVRDGDLWVAMHVSSGITSQGETPSEAVAMVEEAVTLSEQEHTPGDEEFQRQRLEECGIDPDEVTDSIDTPDGMP